MNNFRQLIFNAFRVNKLRNSAIVKNVCFRENPRTFTAITKFPFVPNLQKNTLFSIHKSVLAVSLLTWLGFAKEDEEKESELIMTLKRAVLCMQREQFEKAEQMLHLALRIAQQQQNEQGIVYCYDLMANLAFDQRDLNKAHKLFVSVLQMLLSSGIADDDIKVIHISLKLARICQLYAEIENAEIGYKWCLEQIKKKKAQTDDSKVLNGVIHDWYAQFLLDKGEVNKALVHLKEAHKICSEMVGNSSDEAVLLLNDLGTTSFRAEDMVNAEKYLTEAVSIGKQLEDKSHLGVVQANLGLVLLDKGFMDLAEKNCKEAWHLGRKLENSESINQASYCLDQIKMNLEEKSKKVPA
ncbi:tetratricopeptide repeat protein 19 homolog, mitochondrial isoform X1 [Diabrotica virgifera virgifera]|uniref:Tetratricopeptide repeat protein 19 homolog, mitochondrial n=1 Tax=Diabrotica virgifera virgifera TaxID=50390 RepID=A0ABM5IRV8_DIAVI|nr:tetratricopeptide repeat protein 19 homolog, mitochondrial isoform X1 [Diabrotica virgifera virgifera]